MIDIIKKRINLILVAISLLIVITSFTLGIHNATLYNPKHGFDGEAHVYYIKYLQKNKKLPPTGYEGEVHQSPLYYAIGAMLMNLSGTWKTAQYINTFIFYLIVGISGLAFKKVLKDKHQVLIGMFSLLALPMLNIFPAMISNELFNTFWIISSATACIYLISAKNNRQFVISLIWLTGSVIFGFWTKVTIFLILPTVICAILTVIFLKKIKLKNIIIGSIFAFFIIVGLAFPIIMRSQTTPNASNMVKMVVRNYTFAKPDFYYRLDWIPKVDMYNTQYYSLLGAAWNSYWTDGHNAITPFIKFHKKSFILWLLGFILLPLSIFGLRKLWSDNKVYGILMIIMGITMFGAYIFMNLGAGHYSAARLTYEMGIVLPYAFGLASASQNKKLKVFLLILLSIQFIVMVSFFWILPWWHVTK